jgi:hypothetical protein
MKLAEFNKRFAENEPAYKQLFRRFRIKSTGVNGIREGYERFGNPFLLRAIDILNDSLPAGESFSNLEDPYLENEAYVDDIPFDTAAVAAANKPTGKFWDFMGNMLGLANSTAATIANVKGSISGTGSGVQQTQTPQPSKPNYLMIGAGIAVLILIILLLKPKK